MEATALALSDYELERGKPMPSKNHALIQSRLIIALALKYSDLYDFMSEATLEVSGEQKIPDIAIYPKLVFDPLRDEISMKALPLCAIEILSPSQSLDELVNKTNDYFEAGVRSCWIVLPRLKTVYVFSTPEVYEPFTQHSLLHDTEIGVELQLSGLFG
ncbi:MAG: Uma2 family endonuclease [Saprospiraceae bacterium]